MRTTDIACPDRSSQAIFRIVPLENRIVLILEWDDRQHWPEYLLPCDPHVVGHRTENGRFYEVSQAADPLPAHIQFRATAPAHVDVTQHPLHLLRSNKRTELG